MKAKQKKTLLKLKKKLHRHLKLALIPHKANRYRPHLIRRYGLALLLGGIIILQLGYNALTTGTVLGTKTLVTSQGLLDHTNIERAKYKREPLALDDKLSEAAFLKAKDMFKQQYWAHTAPDGTTPWQWFEKVNYNHSYAGENLAKNFHADSTVAAAWMASIEHRENMLSEHYTQVGFATVDGVLDSKPTSIVVALYGAPASRAAVAGVTTNRAAEASLASTGILTQFGLGIQALSPAAIGALTAALIAGVVALGAHLYRARLPKKLLRSWYRHHGALKATGMVGICIVTVFLYSGGQI